jgi:hypothetical protein
MDEAHDQLILLLVISERLFVSLATPRYPIPVGIAA